jgi:hypothetical protein
MMTLAVVGIDIGSDIFHLVDFASQEDSPSEENQAITRFSR